MTDVVNVYRGKPGASNVDGSDGLGVSDVRGTLLDSMLFDVLKVNQLSQSGIINFDRGSLASHNNRHHDNVWVRSSTTTNYIPYSNDFTNWSDGFGRWTRIGNTTDPFGGTGATEINLDVDTDDLAPLLGEVVETVAVDTPVGGNLTVSFWIKVISGDVSTLDITTGTVNVTMAAPTGDFQRVTKTINSTGAGIFFAINPRGKTGARVALYGVQIEDNNTATDLIETSGAAVTENFLGEIERESDKGWLIEEEKENVVHLSGDLSKWTATNVTIDTYSGEDPFNVTEENIRLVWGSVDTITLETTTETLTASTAYTVSMWVYTLGGSLNSLSVSLGGGTAVEYPSPSTTGFTRLDVEVTSGAGSGLIITGVSTNKTASVLISSVQAELGTLTSYLKTGTLGQTRLADVVTCDIPFNIPRPDLPWTFRVTHKSVLNNAAKKYIAKKDTAGDYKDYDLPTKWRSHAMRKNKDLYRYLSDE